MIIFVVGQLATKEDVSELRKVFKNFDLNSDGSLGMRELVAAWEVSFDEERDNAIEEI